MTPLVGWENFYIIIGSSAAALTGLMFVVITLTAERRGTDDSAGLDAFASPTVLHFCAVLLVAAILTTPGHTTASLSFCLTVVGLGGIAYTTSITIRMRRQKTYAPVTSDWIWHILLPLVAYVCLLGSGAVVWGKRRCCALFRRGWCSLAAFYRDPQRLGRGNVDGGAQEEVAAISARRGRLASRRDTVRALVRRAHRRCCRVPPLRCERGRAASHA